MDRLIYISCVGEQDPKSDTTGEEGSLLTCWRHLIQMHQQSLDALYLIPTAEKSSPERHTQKHAQECLQYFDEPDKATILPLFVRNPANLKEVYPALRKILEQVSQNENRFGKSKDRIIHINTSSGTPQMKESLPFLATIGFWVPAKVYHWQVLDPRSGIVQRVHPAPEMDLLEQERFLLRLKRMAAYHLYGGMAEEFRQLSDNCNLDINRELVQWVLGICRMLESIDHKWAYDEALNQCKALLKNRILLSLPHHQDWETWLKGVQENLEQIKKETPQALGFERYQKARRSFSNVHCPEAIIFAFVACETALSSIWDSKQSTRRGVRALDGDFGKWMQTIKNDLQWKHAAIELPGLKRMFLPEAIDWLRQKRNDIVHNTQVASSQLAQHAIKIAGQTMETWLKRCAADFDNDPLAPKVVEHKLTELLELIRNSLWQ